MDYWKDLDVTVYDDFADFLEKNPECRGRLYMATTKAKHVYTDVDFEEDAYIMFGKESAGIPEEILVDYEDSCVRIPMLENIRSLNLSNSVAVVLYEALRQQNFKQMQLEGRASQAALEAGLKSCIRTTGVSKDWSCNQKQPMLYQKQKRNNRHTSGWPG